MRDRGLKQAEAPQFADLACDEPDVVLELRDVDIAVGGHGLLHDLNLTVRAGECHALFGPNASGKTALLKTIMGLADYVLDSGQILVWGEDITPCSIDERARRGVGSFFQRPPVIHGVSLGELVQLSEPVGLGVEEIRVMAEDLGCADLLGRDVDDDLSGGETKLAELLQLAARAPTLCLVDEPDAGVDADNIEVIGRTVAALLEGHGGRAAIVISHSGRIFDFLEPTTAHILAAGTLIRHGDAQELLGEIRAHGYRGLSP